MKRIALGVTKISGAWILQYLSTRPDVKIVGVDSMTDRPGQIDCGDEIEWLKLPRKTYKEIVELKPDIFINISYPKVIKRDLLDICPCVNLHMGKLPEYRGRNVFAHAIQNREHFYTVTLHLMSEGLDEGDIIAERTLPIYITDTSKTLHDRAEIVSYQMFVEELQGLLDGTFKTRPQVGQPNYFGKTLRKEIDFRENDLDIYNKIRSLDFPPYEPAYFRRGKEKVCLRINDVCLIDGKLVIRPDVDISGVAKR